MKHRTHCTSRDCTFSLTSTAEKPPSEEAWTTTDRATRTFLSFQKKPENEAHQFPTNPGGYVDERFHIPHPRQSQSIVDQCMALERQNALTPRGESVCHRKQRLHTGPPVILIRGLQLSSSRFPGPTKTLRTLILTDDQSRETGRSERPAPKTQATDL